MCVYVLLTSLLFRAVHMIAWFTFLSPLALVCFHAIEYDREISLVPCSCGWPTSELLAHIA